MQYKTDQEWRDALASSDDPELQKAYTRWQALGGDKQIALPEDFKQPAQKKQFTDAGEARAYIESVRPKIQADYGDGSTQHYEEESARLQNALNSGALSKDERTKVTYLLDDLNSRFRDQAQAEYKEKLQNAGSDEEAQQIIAKMEGLKNVSVDDPNTKILSDIVGGGTGFGNSMGSWDGQMPTDAGGMGGDFLNGVMKQWNDGATTEDVYDRIGNQLVDNAALRKDEQLGYYGQASGRAEENLGAANTKATTETQEAIDALTKSGQYTKEQITALIGKLTDKQATTDKASSDAIKQLQGDYSKFGTERDAATNDYTAALDPLKKQLTAGDYTAMVSSPDDIKRLIDSYGNLENNAAHGADQLQDVYGKYNELSNSGMTDQERAMLEAGNRSATRSQKSFMDATTRGLADRGTLTGDALLGATGQNAAATGDTRLDTILGALASVQKRKQDALAGMGTTASSIASQKNTSGANLMTGANTIRSGNDLMTQANKTQEGITQRFKSTFEQSEMDRLADLAQKRQDTILSKTSGDLTAATGINNSVQDQLDKAFGRETQVTNTGLTGVQNSYAIDKDADQTKIDAADREAGRAAGQANFDINNASTYTGLVGSTSKDEDDALEKLLGYKTEKANLKNNGVVVV